MNNNNNNNNNNGYGNQEVSFGTTPDNGIMGKGMAIAIGRHISRKEDIGKITRITETEEMKTIEMEGSTMAMETKGISRRSCLRL